MSRSNQREIISTLRSGALNEAPCLVAVDTSAASGSSIVVAGTPGRRTQVHWFHLTGANSGNPAALQLNAGATSVFAFFVWNTAPGTLFFPLSPSWALPEGEDLIFTRTAIFGAARCVVGYDLV